MHQEFPKWVYPNGDASKGVIVQNAEQEAALAPAAPEIVNLDDGVTATEATEAPPAPAPRAKAKPGRKAK